jgi:hypothetical protein
MEVHQGSGWIILHPCLWQACLWILVQTYQKSNKCNVSSGAGAGAILKIVILVIVVAPADAAITFQEKKLLEKRRLLSSTTVKWPESTIALLEVAAYHRCTPPII